MGGSPENAREGISRQGQRQEILDHSQHANPSNEMTFRRLARLRIAAKQRRWAKRLSTDARENTPVLAVYANNLPDKGTTFSKPGKNRDRQCLLIL
jgi:hypothetical protein